MPFVETRLISPTTLTTSAASALYTVPTGYSAIIKQLVVTNITGTPATFTFYIGATVSASNALFSGTSVAGNDTVIINLSQVLSTGENLRALASTGSALNLTVSGVINDGPLASTATYIPDNAITVNKIADSSITTAKIAAGAVATVDLAENAVTQAKLATTLSGTTITTNALRSTAIPSPFAGQTCYETDTNRMYVWNGTAWVIPNQTTQNPEGLELVGKVVAGSGVTTLSINNVFSDSYDAYKIIIAGGTSSGSSTLSMQLIDSSGNPVTTGYYETFIYSAYAGSTVASANGNNLSNFQRTANSFGYSMTGSFEILNPFSAQPTYYFNAPSPLGGNAGQSIGYQTSVSSYTGMKLTISAGTISSTVLTVYGYRK